MVHLLKSIDFFGTTISPQDGSPCKLGPTRYIRLICMALPRLANIRHISGGGSFMVTHNSGSCGGLEQSKRFVVLNFQHI